MGDSRFEQHYARVRHADDPRHELDAMEDEEVVQALAAASTHEPSPYLANILASEAMNRLRRARLVNEHIGEGVVVLDAQGCIRSMNPASVSMLGYEPRQLQGRDLSEICVERAKGHRCAHRVALEEQRTISDAEDAFLHADGRVLTVSSTAAPVIHDGHPESIIVAWRDVTASKLARRKIEESEARYRSLFENSPDLVITLDRAGRIVALNPAGERLSRWVAEDVRGQRVLPFVEPADQERARLMLEEAFEGRVRQTEFEVRQPDGSLAIYDALGIPILVGDEVVGVHGVARNITHLRRLEEGVRVSMARYELIMAGVRDHAVVLLSRNRAIESWNPGAERLFGWRTADVLGRGVAELFPARRGTSVASILLDEVDRSGRAEVDGPARRADGSRVYVSGSVNRIQDATGVAHGYVAVLRDATPRRRAQLELRRALAIADTFVSARELLVEGIARCEEGRIVYANRALLEIAGRERAALVGSALGSLFAPGRADLPPELESRPRGWTRTFVRAVGEDGREMGRQVEVAFRHIDPVEGAPADGWIVIFRRFGREGGP